MRVYIPADLSALRELQANGRLSAPLHGCAVTGALREWYAEGDAEELEYSAMQRASAWSLELVHDEGTPRRIVIAVDVADASPSGDDSDPSLVDVAGDITTNQVASIHVDASISETAVRLAFAALEAAKGDPEADLPEVDDLDDLDLLWFATQELDDLIAELSA